MSNLYGELARVYEIMYPSFINYQEELEIYGGYFKKYGKRKILELGCGTGELARLFCQEGFDYTGLDLSGQMLSLAKIKAKDGVFLKGDMRNFQLGEPVEGIIMAGRTISYLLSNEDLKKTFTTVHRNLKNGGIFCFDFIDAKSFFGQMAKNGNVIHKVSDGDVEYIRESLWEARLENGIDFFWLANYFQKTASGQKKIGEDRAAVRTFTKPEIEIFLQFSQFKILHLFERPSYFFPTYFVIAEKQK